MAWKALWAVLSADDPGRRSVDCKPNRGAVRSCHAVAPNGARARRTAAIRGTYYLSPSLFPFRAGFLRFEHPADHFLQVAEEGFVSQGPAGAGVPTYLPEVLFR